VLLLLLTGWGASDGGLYWLCLVLLRESMMLLLCGTMSVV
jgi:hypothetical protein